MSDKVKIIAEIGVNHNGDMTLAKDTIDAARDSGAHIVKFQLFSANKLASAASVKSGYQIKNTGEAGSQLEMLKRLELSIEEMAELRDYCALKGLSFLLSAFDDDSLKALKTPLNLSQIKIPSGEITNIPMLIQIGREFDQIILSSGMSLLRDIELAVATLCFGRAGGDPETFKSASDAVEKIFLVYDDVKHRAALLQDLTLLQCTSEYPAPVDEINLGAIKTMAQAFHCDVGFSDHTLGTHIPVAAVAMGARVIEKHFTLDKNLPGPDHLASSSPEEFQEMVKQIDDVQQAMGDGVKVISPSEMGTINVARKFVTATQPIGQGDIFSDQNIGVKRGKGTQPPIALYDFYGKTALESFEIDDRVE